MDKTFKFNLGQNVTIAASGEHGTIHGRAEYTTGDNSYFLRYKAADGRATEAWWQENSLQPSALTEGDAAADLAGTPRPDHPSV